MPNPDCPLKGILIFLRDFHIFISFFYIIFAFWIGIRFPVIQLDNRTFYNFFKRIKGI